MDFSWNDMRRRHGALAAVALGVFCIQLDSFALNLALPTIGRDLGAADGDLQWAISAYLLTVGTCMLGAGRLGDLYGRRHLLRVGVTAFGVGSLLCALSPTLALLVAARVLQGAGGALIMPVGLALLTNVYPSERRARATGLAIGLGSLATALGPFIGGALTDIGSWRAIFWINVPVALAAVWSLAGTEESRDENGPRRLDVLGLTLATLALACVATYVDRAPVWGWLSASAISLLLGMTILGATFIYWERRTAFPLVDLALFANRPFVVLTFSGAVANTATVVFLFVVPLSLQGPWGLTPVVAGLAFLAPSVFMAAAGPVAGRVHPEHAIAVMAASLLISAVALLTAAHTIMLTTYVVAIAICGAGLGVANALTLVATQGMVTPGRAGEASGVTKTVITVAAGFGVVLAAPAADPRAPASTNAVVLTSVALSALVTVAILGGVLTAARRFSHTRRSA